MDEIKSSRGRKRETRPSPLEVDTLYAILDLPEADRYAVPIADRLTQITGHEQSSGAIYAVLMRLEKKGLVDTELGDPTPERGGKAKRFYQVNAEGRNTLAEAERRRAPLRDLLADLGLRTEAFNVS